VKNNKGYIIPTPLSEWIEKLEDWELVEYASRYAATSKYCLNGASDAKMFEVKRVWKCRYKDEELPIIGCVPPLNYESSYYSQSFDEEPKDE